MKRKRRWTKRDKKRAKQLEQVLTGLLPPPEGYAVRIVQR